MTTMRHPRSRSHPWSPLDPDAPDTSNQRENRPAPRRPQAPPCPQAGLIQQRRHARRPRGHPHLGQASAGTLTIMAERVPYAPGVHAGGGYFGRAGAARWAAAAACPAAGLVVAAARWPGAAARGPRLPASGQCRVHQAGHPLLLGRRRGAAARSPARTGPAAAPARPAAGRRSGRPRTACPGRRPAASTGCSRPGPAARTPRPPRSPRPGRRRTASGSSPRGPLGRVPAGRRLVGQPGQHARRVDRQPGPAGQLVPAAENPRRRAAQHRDRFGGPAVQLVPVRRDQQRHAGHRPGQRDKQAHSCDGTARAGALRANRARPRASYETPRLTEPSWAEGNTSMTPSSRAAAAGPGLPRAAPAPGSRPAAVPAPRPPPRPRRSP